MRSRSFVVAVVWASLAGACASGAGGPTKNAPGDDPPPTTSVDESSTVTGQIEGDWIIIEGVPTVAGYPISLSVTGNEFSGRSACNLYGGTAGIDGASLTIEDMGMTDMGCEEPVMDSESAYLRALAAVTAWKITDDRLELLGPPEPLVFERAPEVPISELVGTVWVLETVIEGDEAFSAVGDPATLILNDDGSLSGSTGCRSLDGSWTLANGQVFLPELSADGRCKADLAVQDGIVVNVLGDGFTPSVDGGVLTLTSMGNEGLVYRVEG